MKKSHFSSILEAINDESINASRSNEEKSRKKLKGYAGWIGMGALSGAAKGASVGYGIDKVKRMAGKSADDSLIHRQKNLSGNIARRNVVGWGLTELRKEVAQALPQKMNKKFIGKSALVGAGVGAAIAIPQKRAWDKFKRNKRVREYYKNKMEHYFGED